MARAAEEGLRVLRLTGDSARYDVAIEAGGRFVRVQVKSTMCRCRNGRSYACATHPNQRTHPYRRREFDFLAAYVIPEDVWYIIPARLVIHGRMGMIILTPSLPGHKYEPYKEAWGLLRRPRGRAFRVSRSSAGGPGDGAQLTLERAPSKLGSGGGFLRVGAALRQERY